MKDTLFDRCKVNTNLEEDVFVGIKKDVTNYKVSFPLGFHMGENERELRKDILMLLSILARYTEKKESSTASKKKDKMSSSFPIYSYLYIIKDFFNRGYYKKREVIYHSAKRGKINWSRTIKTQKPVIQGDEAYYLNFVVKKDTINENELITLVHKFCVYESFDKLGWLFTSFVPEEPQHNLKRKFMLSIVNTKLQNTFNDKDKQLFLAIKEVLQFSGDDVRDSFEFGTNRFEYVWEAMLDKFFGVKNKMNYYPKTSWNFSDGSTHDNAFLEPDTIMIHRDKIYVLDAKYYKFGWSGIPAHLPESTSINKQITYGEYIAEAEKFKVNGHSPLVYNAFIMPYDSQGRKFPTNKPYHCIGNASSDWKKDNQSYENVVGILMDVKYLMKQSTKSSLADVEKLAELIEAEIINTTM